MSLLRQDGSYYDCWEGSRGQDGAFAEILPDAATRALAASDAMSPAGARALLATMTADPLAFAIVAAESGYRSAARGPQGEYGLGQLTLATARGLGFAGHPIELLDPHLNLSLTLSLLEELRRRFGSDDARIASGYNCGPDRCRRSDGSYTNRAYVDRVLSLKPSAGPLPPGSSTSLPPSLPSSPGAAIGGAAVVLFGFGLFLWGAWRRG